MNLPQPEGFIDSDSTSERKNEKDKPKIVVILSNKFIEQELSPAEELKGLSNINLGGNEKEKSRNKDFYPFHDQQNKMERTSTTILNEKEINYMEPSSTDEEDNSSMTSIDNNNIKYGNHDNIIKNPENYATTIKEDSKNISKNPQTKVPKPVGKTSYKITKSNVYAPSKQDGGGEAS